MKRMPLKDYLSQPLSIKDQPIEKRIVLAPMAGLGHIALRQLISEFGGFGLLFTGMCSAKAVPHENPRVSLVFKWNPEELSHTVCQIFGSEPDIMAKAAKRIEKEGFFGVDLNFGCSVSAICKKGCGAALLKDPALSEAIVRKVSQTISIPLFVKFRTGWENNPELAVEMAKRFEDAGAHALTFHPRVAPDRRSRPPKWEQIALVKQAVSIPVFGNGNLFTEQDALNMIDQTGCDGLSIGRMGVARPWLFAQWSEDFRPPETIFYEAAIRLTHILELYFNDYFSTKLFKKYLPYFCANFKFGHHMLKKLAACLTIEEMRNTLNDIFKTQPETLQRPNQHLFL